MKTIKRWTAGIIASFDGMIRQIENHEALVDSAIREAQECGARAKARLSRVRNDGALMRRKLVELADEKTLWEDRAKRVAEADEAKAIECLRRRVRVERQMVSLEAQEREHAKAEKQLTQDLSLIDERIGRLRAQRNLLRTRQTRAEALRAASGDDTGTWGELDEIFERWDAKITECEMHAEAAGGPLDDLAGEFEGQEEEAELKALLQTLRAEQRASA